MTSIIPSTFLQCEIIKYYFIWTNKKNDQFNMSATSKCYDDFRS